MSKVTKNQKVETIIGCALAVQNGRDLDIPEEIKDEVLMHLNAYLTGTCVMFAKDYFSCETDKEAISKISGLAAETVVATVKKVGKKNVEEKSITKEKFDKIMSILDE